MKKYNIFLLSALALGFASCEDTSDLGIAQVNPQEPVFSSENILYSPASAINANTAGETNVAALAVNDLPEGYSLSGATMTLSTAEDFATSFDVPLKIEGETLLADGAQIGQLYAETFTKDPAKVNLYAKTVVSTAKGAVCVNFEPLAATYEFTPLTPAVEIAPAYYVVLGNGTNWDIAGAIKMNHPDVSQYDDPNFSVVVKDASAAGDKWIILSQASYDQAVSSNSIAGVECLVPTEGTDDASGEFEKVQGSAIDASKLLTLTVPAQVSLDAEYLTFSAKEAVETYYATGDGWSNWSAHWMPLTTTNYTDYNGFLNLQSEFKFAPQADWGGDFGSSDPLEETDDNGVFDYKGILNRAGANIKISHAGLYFATLNVANWELSLNGINSMGLVGGFNNWGNDGDPDVAMTASEDLMTWTCEVTVEAGQEWKFRANSSWAVNLGGTPDALTAGGANIVLPDAGTYTITLDLNTYPATFTAVKK